jgi:hypothetical protein
LGVRLRETIILGKQIHGAIWRVLPFERRAATDCMAWLYAKGSHTDAVRLWWRSMDESRRCLQTVTMRNGETYELLLFPRLHSDPSRYFIFAPQDESGESPAVPNDAAKFDDTREFRVRINYSDGHQRFSFETAVRKQLDGTLRYDTKGAGTGGL